MKTTLIRQFIGGASALLGICWIGFVFYPVLRLFLDNGTQSNYLVTLMIIPMMLIPGVLAVKFGIRLFRSMSIESLRWVVGIFVAFGVFFLSSTLQRISPSLLSDHITLHAFLFIGGLIALPFYSYILRFIISYVDPSNDRSSISIGKGGLILLAWILWVLLSAVFREYSPIKDGYTHIPEEPWGLLGLLASIIIAYGFYRITALLFLKPRQNEIK